jgi:hypothetical protein
MRQEMRQIWITVGYEMNTIIILETIKKKVQRKRSDSPRPPSSLLGRALAKAIITRNRRAFQEIVDKYND